MEYMSKCDFYEVRLGSILSDSDRKILLDLYQPIIGAKAIALFFKLWADSERDDEQGFYSIDKLLLNMQISNDEILIERRHLEALGLMKTYQKNIDAEKRSFLFYLFAPKQPADFFEDKFFNSILSKYIGKKEVQKLANHYKIKINTKGYKDITATFGEVFYNDINSIDFKITSDLPKLKGKRTSGVNTKFNKTIFVELLVKHCHLSPDFLSDSEVTSLGNIAEIYGLSESKCVEHLEYFCDFNASYGKRIDLDKAGKTFKNLSAYDQVLFNKPGKRNYKYVATDGKYADFIDLLEHTPSSKFLSLMQNNTIPSPADSALIEGLATNYGLPSGLINVLISYTLEVKNNTLPRNYVEKVAASLVREGVTSVVEALNYLNRVNKNNKSHNKTKAITTLKSGGKYFENDDEEVEFDVDLEDEE